MLAAKLGYKDVFTWKIGDPPMRNKVDPFSQLYVEVTVDGPELDYVKTQFRGLPYHASRTMQTWYGAHAQFIVGNIQ